MRLRKYRLYFIALFCAVISIVGVLYFRRSLTISTSSSVQFEDNNFDPDVTLAIDKLSAGNRAKVISRVESADDAIAIVFSSMKELSVANKVLDIIKKYDLNASFFISGLEAAEYQKITTDISDSGNEVGSYSLYASKHMNELLTYEMIDDFVYSYKLIERALGEVPNLLLCNNTTYTNDILRAAYVSGFDYVVKPTNILSYQSFSDYETARNYLRKQPNGSIIEIKLDGVLDAEEFMVPDIYQSGSTALISEEDLSEVLPNEHDRVLMLVEWICKAIKEDNRSTVFLTYTSASETINRLGPRPDFLTEATALLSSNAGKLRLPENLGAMNARALSYSFYGIGNQDALINTLNRLNELRLLGTFYITEDEITSYPDAVSDIIAAGQNIGLMPTSSDNATEVCESLIAASYMLAKGFDIKTDTVIAPHGNSTRAIEEAVSAAGLKLVKADSSVVISADEFETDAAKITKNRFGELMSELKYGQNVLTRLDFYKNSNTLTSEILSLIKQHDDALLRIGNIRLLNKGRLAVETNYINTTERALSFIFYGIDNQKATNDTLARLREINATGTFFVSQDDINKYSNSISTIIANGHEIGIALTSNSDWDFFTAARTLSGVRNLINQRFGIDARLTMLPFGSATQQIKEAVSALGMSLISPTFSIVKNDNEFETSPNIILSSILRNPVTPPRRGEIIYFRLNFYKNSDTLIGDLLLELKRRYVDSVKFPGDYTGESAYNIVGLGKMMSNSDAVYSVSAIQSNIPANVISAVSAGRLDGMSKDHIVDIISKCYIGNPDIIESTRLPGFSEQDIAKLDTTGKINTGGSNTVFLTFDDWGDDKRVNQLLYVLKKHNIKAGFFIRTNYVYSNPNLLRAIAKDGHDIASHTVNHMTLSEFDQARNVYMSISEQSALSLEKELVDSYATLVSIAGDITNEKGLPVVRPYFRAPTLAVSYLGVKEVFDCGYTYMISGDLSIGDYAAASPYDIVNTLNRGVSSGEGIRRMEQGSIVVMHFSVSAQFTAEALDIYLTENSNKPEGVRVNFARLSDYLG